MCTITVDGRSITVTLNDKSVLDALERNDIPLQAHCRNGFCGVCRTHKVKGEVEYHIDPLAFIEDDEILPCSCLPVGRLELTMVSAVSMTRT